MQWIHDVGERRAAVKLEERLRAWAGMRVNILFTNDESQTGELREVGDDYIVLLAGSLEYVISFHSIARVNQVREL
jgi:hypothetical protein